MGWSELWAARPTSLAGQIGNLLDDPTWVDWDFADEPTREGEMNDAVAAIRPIGPAILLDMGKPDGLIALEPADSTPVSRFVFEPRGELCG
jgi:hypothetical protein